MSFEVTNRNLAVGDITARERELERQVTQLERLELVGRLAGGVAHDFNNLLTVILGYTDLLKELATQHDDAALCRAVDEIDKAATRGASLTRQLLALGRRNALKPSPVDVAAVLRGLEKLLRRLLPEDVRLDINTHGEAWAVADPGQLEQVIANLAINARDALPSGGQIEICLMEAFGQIQLTVTDTGTGMDAETLGKVFDPFFTTKGEGRGTGLGLPTVQSIVRQHGGEITLTSTLGAGTTVNVTLPAIEAPAAKAAPVSAPKHVACGHGETVLVVEDDRTVRRMLEVTLTREGYVVLPTADVNEASEIGRTHRGSIDVMISDVVLPSGNGVDLAAHLHASRPGLKVIFMSAHTEHPALARCIRQADAPFLTKPFAPRDAIATIRTVLAGAVPAAATLAG